MNRAALTLFLQVPDLLGVLVTRTGKSLRQRALNFKNVHAALDWCLEKHVDFVLYHRHEPSDPANN